MTDTNSVYVVGDYANIIHYGDSVSTITSTSNPSPFAEEFKCEVFPNPAVNQITIKSNFKISTICIKDISGRTVYTKTCNTKELIANVSFLSEGIYFITQVSDEGRNCSSKLVIKKAVE